MNNSRQRSPISDAELERRWAGVRKFMDDKGLDAIVMQNTSDWVGGYVRWFTDAPAANGYPKTVIFYRDAPMTLIEMGPFGGERDLKGSDAAQRGIGRHLNTPSFVSVSYTNHYDGELALSDLRSKGVRRLGMLTPAVLPHGLVSMLEQGLPATEIVDVTDEIDLLKAIKSQEEIGEIRKLAALQDAVFAAVCNHIRPGMTDVEVTSFARTEGNRLGSDQGIFLGSSAPLGTAARFLDRGMQGRTIQQDDNFTLLIEINGPSGLYLEIARTMVLGRADQHLLDSFALMKAAQDHSLSLIKPGVKAADIAAAHDEWMVQHGLQPEKRLYAHGQGVDMVERPLIRHDETMTLAEGMCLAVHPGFDDGKVFAVICDNYIVESDGVGPCLHMTDKKIFELG